MPLPFTDQAEDDLDACVEMMRGGSKTFLQPAVFYPNVCARPPLLCMRFAEWPMTWSTKAV